MKKDNLVLNIKSLLVYMIDCINATPDYIEISENITLKIN